MHSTKLYKQFSKKVVTKASDTLLNLLKKSCAFAVLFIVGASIFPKDLENNIDEYYKAAVEKLNFKIESVEITGNEKLNISAIQKKLDTLNGENIYLVDLDIIKAQITEEPWVASVMVERILPSTLYISITEETPQALYVEKDQTYLINIKGKKIERVNAQEYPEYMRVIGKDANLEYQSLLNQLHNSSQLYNNIETLELLKSRRWDIILKNKSIVHLPQHGVLDAISLFSMHLSKITQIDKRYVLDLRLIPDRIYIESEDIGHGKKN